MQLLKLLCFLLSVISADVSKTVARIIILNHNTKQTDKLGILQVITQAKNQPSDYELSLAPNGHSLNVELKYTASITMPGNGKFMLFTFIQEWVVETKFRGDDMIYRLNEVQNNGECQCEMFLGLDSLPSGYIQNLFLSFLFYNPDEQTIKLPIRSDGRYVFVFGCIACHSDQIIDVNDPKTCKSVNLSPETNNFTKIKAVVFFCDGNIYALTYNLKMGNHFSNNTRSNRIIFVALVIFACFLPIVTLAFLSQKIGNFFERI